MRKGLTNPATIGADVCHLNLQNFCYSSWRWWTRCWANLCKREISSVLPSNPLVQVGGEKAITAISGALTALP
jgi:glycine dehydrogenase